MDDRYEAYCVASPVYYDRMPRVDTARFQTSERTLPAGWRRVEQEDWYVFAPDGVTLPAQGWKIHVGACPDNAERILDAVWDYCVRAPDSSSSSSAR